MFLLQFAETCRPCGINICDISVGKRKCNKQDTSSLKFVLTFETEGFFKKREVDVDQAMVYIYRQISFCVRVTFLKNMTHVEHKIPVQNVVFPGGLGV
jgi:hypothetical protein